MYHGGKLSVKCWGGGWKQCAILNQTVKVDLKSDGYTGATGRS